MRHPFSVIALQVTIACPATYTNRSERESRSSGEKGTNQRVPEQNANDALCGPMKKRGKYIQKGPDD